VVQTLDCIQCRHVMSRVLLVAGGVSRHIGFRSAAEDSLQSPTNGIRMQMVLSNKRGPVLIET